MQYPLMSSNGSHNFSIEKPILRWAGGKNWLLKDLTKYLPKLFNNYHELFLGGASVFLSLKPSGKAYLSDTNFELINALTQIKINVDDLILALKQYKNTKDEYYKVRESVYEDPIKQAARFIYLNRTCFNGIYRVNLKGEFNVPYGFKEYKNLFEFNRLRKASKILQSAELSVGDFGSFISNIEANDLVFLDPPYTVSHVKNGFIKYNEKLFSLEDQKRLAKFISKIKEKNAFYIMTNAKHDVVLDIFGNIDLPISISRASVIGGKKAKREIIEEYLFTNVR